MSVHDILYLCLFFLCLIVSAFFSSSETAFFSMQKVRLRYLVDNQVKGAGTVSQLIEQPAKLLSTILLGNNLVNVAASALRVLTRRRGCSNSDNKYDHYPAYIL